jgi:membrane protein YdbS with pleckstrin-like domain
MPELADDGTLRPFADGVHRPLDPRYIRAQRLVRWITTAVFLLIALPFVAASFFIFDEYRWLRFAPAAVWFVLGGVLAWSSHAWPPLAYRRMSCAVSADGIEIRHGVLWRTVTTVPRSRVQHIDVSQGPIERSHELGTLVIHTAGTDHAVVVLAGLSHTQALRIRDHLLPAGTDDAV